MSYYNGEEVHYIGSIDSQNGNGDFTSDVNSLSVKTIGSGSNTQYYCSLTVNKGDILYLINRADFPQGGYFKFAIGYTFSSSFYSNEFDAKTDLFSQIYNETGDLVVYGGSSMFCDYLGKGFSLSQLADEPPTEAPTQPPTQKLTEAPTQPPTEAELPTGGEVLETSYNFSGLTIKNADEIINNSMGVVPSMIVAVVPLAIVAFSVGFGVKKALSYFRTVGRGGH